MKEKLLELTSTLKENVKNAKVDECAQNLVKIQELVENSNNEKITKEFNGIFSDFIGERETTVDATVEHIESFEKSIEKNLELVEMNDVTDKLNSDFNKKTELYTYFENLKYGIMCKDLKTITESIDQITVTAHTLLEEDNKKINSALLNIGNIFVLSDKNIKDFTEEDIEKALDKVKELEKVIDEISKKPIIIEKEPETIEEIKNEMDKILGVSLLNEIENIDLKDEKYAIITEENLQKLKDLKESIKGYQFSINPDKEKIEEKRLEMYLILGNELFDPYETHKENIALLDGKSKNRFEKLKKDFEEKVNNKIPARKAKETNNILNAIKNLKDSINLGKNSLILSHIRALKVEIEKIEDLELKEKMMKKLDSIEKRINGVGKLSDGKEQAIKELDELENLYKNKGDNSKTPVGNKKIKKKKGKKVVATKSAEPFYKRHKKGLLVAFGITLMAVSIPHLLPAIMYLHSALWGVAVASGVPANAALPSILHELNTIIGAKIGASYAASSGIWTLANGAALNATAAEASILSVLGRLTTIALPFAGAKIAIKNAIKAAKEKIQKRKEKIEKENPERKGHFFKNIKDYAKNKFNSIKDGVSEKYSVAKETVTSKYNTTKENISNKYTEIKENHEKKKEEKQAEREQELASHIKNPYLSKKTNNLIQTLYDNEIIEQDLFDELKEVEEETEAYEMIKKAIKEEKGKGSK